MGKDEIVVEGPEVDFKVFHGSLAEYLIPRLKSHPEGNIIQVNGETGESQTSYELLTRSLQVAEGLRERGIGQEDVIVVIANYSANSIAATFGAIFQGAAVFPIYRGYKTLEFKHYFRLSHPKLVFCESLASQYVTEALESLNIDADLFLLEDEEVNSRFQPFHSILKEVDVENYKPLPVENPREQIAAIATSSGTTGLPKCVAKTHMSHLFQLALREQMPEIINKKPFLQIVQLFWNEGLMALLASCITGMQRIYINNINATKVLETVAKHKPEWALIPTVYFIHIARHLDLHKYDVSSLRWIEVGGTALPMSVAEKVKKEWPAPVALTQGYGLTEFLGPVIVPSSDSDVMSVGKLRPGLHLKVIDVDSGRSLGPNEIGELRFKSTNCMMKCYLMNERATSEAYDDTGFYRTGDLGYYTEDRKLYLTGRIKHMIRCKLLWVSPAEVEDVILKLPGVKDVAVMGIPNEEDGWHPMAVVVKEPTTEITEKDIVDFVACKLSDAKRLRGGVKFVETIPHTPNGKIARQELEDAFLMNRTICSKTMSERLPS